MKPSSRLLLFPALAALTLASCNKETPSEEPAAGEASLELEKSETAARDIPLLPVKTGDTWTYQVRFEIPEGAASTGSPEIDVSHERTRRYIGKISVEDGLPEVDCFEITAPDFPLTRELVEIHENRILLRGSTVIEGGEEKIFWQEPAVPFVVAGMDAGLKSNDLQTPDGSRKIQTQIIGREEIAVPAGRFPSIRMLMTGREGEIEFRRTIWFAPGIGIVREEKTRYSSDKLLVRETHDLVATSLKP